MQTDLFAPVFAAGNGLTVTTIVPVFLHPVEVIFSSNVYVVVSVGEAVGLDTVVLLKPPAGDQLYSCPAVDTAPIDAELPLHIVFGLPALTVGKEFTVITALPL